MALGQVQPKQNRALMFAGLEGAAQITACYCSFLLRHGGETEAASLPWNVPTRVRVNFGPKRQ